jgi:hypothetical protein
LQQAPELRRVTATLNRFDTLFSDSDPALASNQSDLGQMLSPDVRFAVMPGMPAPTPDVAQGAQKPADAAAQAFAAKTGVHLVGLPGDDMAVIDRMLTLLGAAPGKGGLLHLGLIVQPGRQAQVVQRFENHPAWKSVTVISQSDPLVLFAAADCIVMTADLAHRNQLEAEASRMGKPVVLLMTGDAAKDAKTLATALKSSPEKMAADFAAVKVRHDILNLLGL